MRALTLGRYPTAVERIDTLSHADAELWVKRDDLTHPVCGGNKVRKLEWLLADARDRGAKRIVTVGAAGSHHVLSTTYFGKREGFDVEAVLVPQPRTDHVVDVLRAGIALGLHPVPVGSWTGAARAMLRRMVTGGRSTRLFPVGGSSVLGARGYVAAARELAAQVRAGEMPEPDVCVVALGSGGTAAGLAAGFAAEGMKTRVVGVCVSQPTWALRLLALRLARACVRRVVADGDAHEVDGDAREVAGRGGLRLAIDTRFLGAGYGYRTPEGDDAARIAAAVGLALDSTYTAKAFASALWHLGARRGPVILFWHTLSAAPMGELLVGAPSEAALPPRVRRLLLPTS